MARVFAYLPTFFFQILDFIYWTVLIFSLIWRDTENQQLGQKHKKNPLMDISKLFVMFKDCLKRCFNQLKKII